MSPAVEQGERAEVGRRGSWSPEPSGGRQSSQSHRQLWAARWARQAWRVTCQVALRMRYPKPWTEPQCPPRPLKTCSPKPQRASQASRPSDPPNFKTSQPDLLGLSGPGPRAFFKAPLKRTEPGQTQIQLFHEKAPSEENEPPPNPNWHLWSLRFQTQKQAASSQIAQGTDTSICRQAQSQ